MCTRRYTYMTSSQITVNIFIAYDAYATLCGYSCANVAIWNAKDTITSC